MSIKQDLENEVVAKGKNLIREALEQIEQKNYETCIKKVLEAQGFFEQEKSTENVAICLSLMGYCEYFRDKSKYLKALTYLNDGNYLANYHQNLSAQVINEFATAEIALGENDEKMAFSHYEKAKKYASVFDEYSILGYLEKQLANLYAGQSTASKRDPLISLLKIGQTVAAETDINALLNTIAEETKTAIQADRCSVFLYDKEKNELWSKVALGLDSQEIRFPADKGLAGHVVKTGETINIKDAYVDERFNKEIDLQTGYRTKTILCMPIKNRNQEIIGAFQVLNKLEGDFVDEDEDLLIAIGSSAGIALENAQLFQQQQAMFIEQKLVFDSFIDTLATSIDARDSITAGHSLRVKLYSSLIARQMNLDDKNVEIIEKAATLHDIGKIGIRDSVLQKEGKLTDEEYKHIQEHVEITHKILDKIHTTDEFKLVSSIACSHHEKYDGSGYYRKLKGEEIPLGGRILAVSDVFDAITSKRHYRDKMPIMNVIGILLKDSGVHFDKQIVDVFLSISTDKIVKVFLTENHLFLDDEHKAVLEKYSMMDLYNILTQKSEEEQNEEEKTFVGLFNLYYTAKSNEGK